jgi:purine-binding chemotaxis protein CheW
VAEGAREAETVLTFRCGETSLAAAAHSVTEVFRRPRITRVPHAPPSLLGVAQLRGAAIPVVSLALLLRHAEAGETAASRVLLIEATEPIAVLVDEITGLKAVPTGGGLSNLAAGGVYLESDQTLRLVDLIGLIDADFGSVRKRTAARERETAVRDDARTAPVVDVALLTFALAGQSYALPLSDVEEVMALPDRIASLPRADDAILGVTSHRGRLLPIVSLAALLGLQAENPARRVVVARLGETRVGFAVDELQAIRRVPPDTIDAVPALLNRGQGEAQIRSICRIDGGRGLVSILTAERLFREQTVTRTLTEARQEAHAMTEGPAAQAAEPFLIFRLGGEEYGIALSAVEEVVRLPDVVTRVPKAPSFVEGVINVRGEIIPVIDQHRRFSVPGAPSATRRRIIVTRINGKQAGFLVDGASEIVNLGADRTAPSSSLAGEGAKMFDRVARLDDAGRTVLLVDPKELLDKAERDLLAAMQTLDDVPPQDNVPT